MVNCHMKCLNPKGRRKVGLEKQSTDDVVNSSNHPLRFPVLLRGSGTRKTKLNSIFLKKLKKVGVIELTTMVTLKSFNVTLKLVFDIRSKMYKLLKHIRFMT